MSDLLAILDQLDEARAKATPGPWEVTTEYQWRKTEHHVVAGDEFIAMRASIPDAALIVAVANAAPKLTAALRAVLDLADEFVDSSPLGLSALAGAGRAIRAAITAALTPEATS